MAKRLAPRPPAQTAAVDARPLQSAGGFQQSVLRRVPRLSTILFPSRAGRRRHLPGLVILLFAAVWIMRHFLPSGAIPAGSDMLGFVARARENSGWSSMVSVWAPSFYGAPRQFTLDLILGLMNELTGNPIVTVKVLALGTLFGAGATTYLLGYGWYRSRWVATVAGFLYMTSQQSLSRWGTGQLNHEMGFALAPLLIYLLAKCVDEFTLKRAVAFALVLNAELLIRPDVVLWIAPFLILYPVVRAVVCREERRTATTVGRLGLVAIPATIALNMMQIVPFLGGVRAAWVSLGGLYGFQNLIDRSLGAYPSLLGFGREIGYISFTGQQTWQFHPWVPNMVYFGAATILVALAFAALWRFRDHRTIFLAIAAVIASFLGKSVQGPIGEPYRWAALHLPLVPNLRNPNRWLIIQALAYAVLGSLTLRLIGQRVRALAKGSVRARFVRASFAALFAVIDRGVFTVATVPYDQTGRFLVQGSYQGWEHDLGADSSAFTRHPAIADGGWSQRSQDLVAFTTGLLRNHDPAFQEILGATGTKYLARFAYPPSQPHLLHLGMTPFWQQQAIDSIPGFLPLVTNEQGTVYRLSSWSPLASFRPNLALVLGGPSGIAALADFPGVDLRNWAAITAPDAISVGGLPELLHLISVSKLIVVSNETLQDLAVLASDPRAQIPGITSDPGIDRIAEQLGSDASSRQGSLADPAVPIAASQTFKAQGSFTVERPEELEVWARIKSFPTAGRLAFSIDGRAVRTLGPVSPFESGLRWIRVYAGRFAFGSHRVAIRAIASLLGKDFEVDETRVIARETRSSAERQLKDSLAHAANKVAYAFDLQDVGKWNDSFDLYRTRVAVDGDGTAASYPRNFWHILDPLHVAAAPVESSGSPTLNLRLRPRRSYYAFAIHQFHSVHDWSNSPAFFLTIEGTGSGETYEFVVSFGRGQASWLFRDDRRGLRTLAFTPEEAEHGIPPFDWSHVVAVKVSSHSKDSAASIGIGRVEISRPGRVPLTIPITPVTQRRKAIVQDVNGGKGRPGLARISIEPGAASILVNPPYPDLRGGLRLVVPPSYPIRELPAAPVPIERTGVDSYKFTFQPTHPGILMFNQGFDPRWNALVGGSTHAPIPTFSAMNGYLVEPGTAGFTQRGPVKGSIRYTGQRGASVGLALSGLSWIGLGALLLGLVCLDRRKRTHAFGFGPSGRLRSASRTSLALLVALSLLAAGVTSLRAWGKRSEQRVSPYWPQGVGGDASHFWRIPDAKNLRLQQVAGPDGAPAIEVKTAGRRRFYTILRHPFTSPQNWSSRRDVFLYVRGQGMGTRYQFLIYTDVRYEDRLSFSFVDVQPGWRVLVFDLGRPTQSRGSPDLSHVTALRISTDKRNIAASFALGSMTISQPSPS